MMLSPSLLVVKPILEGVVRLIQIVNMAKQVPDVSKASTVMIGSDLNAQVLMTLSNPASSAKLPRFTENSPCFIRDIHGTVRAHKVVSIKRDYLNRRCYSVCVNGYFIQYREDDSRLLSGFEPDFPPHEAIDWSDYRPPVDSYSPEQLQAWEAEIEELDEEERQSQLCEAWEEPGYSDLAEQWEQQQQEEKAFLAWEQFCFTEFEQPDQQQLELSLSP